LRSAWKDDTARAGRSSGSAPQDEIRGSAHLHQDETAVFESRHGERESSPSSVSEGEISLITEKEKGLTKLLRRGREIRAALQRAGIDAVLDTTQGREGKKALDYLVYKRAPTVTGERWN